MEDLKFSVKFTEDDVHAVTGKMIENRLFATGEDIHDRKYFEPAHDALINSWPRMTEGWLEKTGRETIVFINELNNQTHRYFDRKERRRDLLKGSQLVEAEKYFNQKMPSIYLNDRERLFIRRSLNERRKGTLFFAALLAIFSISVGFVANQYLINQGKMAANEKKKREAEIHGEIANLEKELEEVAVKLNGAKTLRVQENYYGDSIELNNIDTMMSSYTMGSVRARLNRLLVDPIVTERDSFKNRILFSINKMPIYQESVRLERDTCNRYLELWKRYTAFKQAGDELRTQGDEKLLAAYRKFLQAKAVGYPPKHRVSEINSIVRETGEVLKHVYNQFMEYGDRRAKAGNTKAALEAYEYAKEIGEAMNLDLKSVNNRITKAKGLPNQNKSNS